MALIRKIWSNGQDADHAELSSSLVLKLCKVSDPTKELYQLVFSSNSHCASAHMSAGEKLYATITAAFSR
ncbi:hypothetical protein CYMTET_44967 [Cymbomonas tetramitiformis]|uniref:Uncharacterized protein n=1 Tax=Cymbomonas tetramitiformis TaxID=36881 RepID=A0AAE0BZ61_9CHLO|nr:hypothetical protein CYMTET_44967 [Cymbomonas tetramitiformis]